MSSWTKGWMGGSSSSTLPIPATMSNLPGTQWFSEEPAFSFGLSYQMRFKCWAICCLVGFILSFLGSLFFVLGDLILFALLYAFGVIVSLAGTGFVVGFFRQLKMMFQGTRLIATIVFLGATGMIFVGAFVIKIGALCIIFVIIQYLAYTWYCLSYIPYARTAVKSTIGF